MAEIQFEALAKRFDSVPVVHELDLQIQEGASDTLVHARAGKDYLNARCSPKAAINAGSMALMADMSRMQLFAPGSSEALRA